MKFDFNALNFEILDANTNAFCRFSGGQRHFEVDGDGEDVVHGKVSFRGA